ncbi:DUF4132 domain-containing protein, partial [candidate division CSSED10-310 bacterium]
VKPLEIPAAIEWRDHPKPQPFYYRRPPKLATASRIQKDKIYANNLKNDSYVLISCLDDLVDEVALDLWNTADPKIWGIYDESLLFILARFGVDSLPGFIKCGERHVKALEALSYVRSPAVAPVMARVLDKKKSAPISLQWFARYPEEAAIGLLPLVVGPQNKARHFAERAVRILDSQGHRDLLRQAAVRYGKEVEDALEHILQVDPLLIFPAKLPRMPDFWDPQALPQILLKGRPKCLPISAIEHIGMMLAFSEIPENHYAGLDDVIEYCDPDSLEKFAWALFVSWMQNGAPSNARWAMQSLAFFGGNATVSQLAPLIRRWPGEAAFNRAVAGLDILAQIGTDVALMHIHSISQKIKFKGLQAKAQQKIAEIAERKGLTQEQLADRLVPDFGLDPSGKLTFDYGQQQFTVGFNEQLGPYIINDQGKKLKDLPKPRKADDPVKSSQALQKWKTLKQGVRNVAKSQILRLEAAMCTQRRWSVQEFRNFMLDQPLMIHLVRRILWGTYNDVNTLQTSFRIDEDRKPVDLSDQKLTLDQKFSIGIPHALELAPEESGPWIQLFVDHELIQPFSQLSRQIYSLSQPETKISALHRFKGKTTPFSRILSLENRGWKRDEPWESGWTMTMIRHFPENLYAQLHLEPGIYNPDPRESGEQTLEEVHLHRDDPGEGPQRILFAELDEISVSELLMDLHGL